MSVLSLSLTMKWTSCICTSYCYAYSSHFCWLIRFWLTIWCFWTKDLFIYFWHLGLQSSLLTLHPNFLLHFKRGKVDKQIGTEGVVLMAIVNAGNGRSCNCWSFRSRKSTRKPNDWLPKAKDCCCWGWKVWYLYFIMNQAKLCIPYVIERNKQLNIL